MRLEGWMEAHPAGTEEWAKHAQLQKLWLATMPAEPFAAAWDRTFEKIAARRSGIRQQAAGLERRSNIGFTRTAGLVAASIVLVIGLLVGALRIFLPAGVPNEPIAVVLKENPLVEDQEPFLVASAEEVVIRRIEGADTNLLVVGVLPVIGTLELAAPGDVRVVHMGPDANDGMAPTVLQTGSRAPVIWAKLDTE
jgi:hypothetical protein